MVFWQVAWQALASERLFGDLWRGYFAMTKASMGRVGLAKAVRGLGQVRTLI